MGVVVACLAAACTSPRTEGRRLALHACHLDHVSVESMCGTYEVFEDRAKGSGRKIALNVAVLPALSAHPAPDPLFILAGGPGQGAVSTASALSISLERVRRDRDIVFVDQRGTGRSNPLKCPARGESSLQDRLGGEPDEKELRDCLATYDADPSHYTTTNAVDDLDDVRAALGYAKINLWGGSYGTRAALVYVRRHEERVRTITLDGVAPFGLSLPLSVAKDGQRALDRLFDDCEKDAECNRAFPDLRARFAAHLALLREHPVETKLTHPLTGAPTPVTIRASGLAGVVRALLYVPELSSLLPLTIDRAIKGDYGPLAAQAWAFRSATDTATGLFLSVVCAEDVPFVKPEQIPAETRGTFLGDELVVQTLAACKVWPRGQVDADFRKPVRSNVPALILSGELDPVTPPSYGEEAKRDLPNGEHRIVSGLAHGATRPGCVGGLIADFLKAGSARGLDPDCLRAKRRPPFAVTFAGNAP
ncbi:MAG: alpha/beta fold hydrolase [Deltaproteobacteria bacterium]|nr:alpha/beta fold hydrolase [Deltaproteobacteria bacterium]